MVDRTGGSVRGNILRFPGARSASQQYAHQLSSIYGQRIIDDPDVALASDHDIYATVMRDPVFATAILQRLHSVAGTEWIAEPTTDKPEDKAAAAIFEELCSHTKRFSQARFMLVPVIHGRTYGYCEGRRRRLLVDENPAMDWYVVDRIRNVDKRRVRFETDNATTGDGVKIHVKMTMWHTGRREWLDVPSYAQPALIRAIYQDREERLGMGEGLMTPIYYYFFAKGKVWQEGLQGLERWAQGIVSAKVALEREGSTGKTNLEIANEWIDTINAMRSRHALVYGEGDEFQVHETSGAGHQMVTDFLNYCDQAVYRLCTGSVRPGGLDTETGARAAAETEQDTSDVLIQYDRQILDEALTEYFFTLLWNQNRSNFVQLGLGKARMPRFRTAKERHEDPQQVATVVQTLLGTGVPLVAQEVYERTGFRMPAKDDEVFEGQQAAPAPPGGGGGYPFDAESTFFTAQMERLATLSPKQRDAEFAMFAKKPKRCPDGTIMPKSGDCTGHEGAKDEAPKPKQKKGGWEVVPAPKEKAKDIEWQPPPDAGQQPERAPSKSADEWRKALSPPQRDALEEYIGTAYEDVRKINTPGQEDGAEHPNKARAITYHLDRAVATAPKYEGKVYRGISGVDQATLFSKIIQPNGTVEFPSFASTSPDEDEALGFATNPPPGGGVLFEIEGHDGADITSINPQEKEILLPRNAKFRIADVYLDTKIGNIWRVKLTAAPKSAA